MTKCPGEGICMTIIIVICAEIVNMVFRLAAQGGKRNPRMLSVGYTAAVGRAGVAPSRQADTARRCALLVPHRRKTLVPHRCFLQ